MSSTSTTPPVTTCPACSAPASGRFCSECGAAIESATCAGCRAQLAPGARFCHRCGTAAGAAATPRPDARGAAAVLPWGVAAIALLALIALVAGQRFGATRAPAAAAPTADGAEMRAPDISNMSPREQADRLFDRVMRYASEGKVDSVKFFAPMALDAIDRLAPLDAHLRYDLGLVAAVSGDAELARAQADTILSGNPNHLLGLSLAARAATMRGDQGARAEYDRRLLSAEPAERAKGLEEYKQHDADILNAIAEAKRQ